MKKILTLILALGLVALAGCGSADKTASDAGKDAESQVTSESTDKTATGTASNISDKVKEGTVELCEYKDVKLDWESDTNSTILNNHLSNYTKYTKEIKDRAVKNGDVANIDYAGYKNGKAFDGGTAQGYDLQIGSGQFIPGFEEGLVGAKPGETKNLDLTFPENYHSADLAGQAVVFKVTVNYIKEEAYKEEDIKAAKESAFGQALMNHVISNSTFGKLDTDLTKFYEDKYLQIYENQIKNSYGYESIDAYLEAAGSTRESFDATIKGNSEYRAMHDTAVNAIAEKEGINISQDEYKKRVKQYAEASQITVEEFEKQNGKTLIMAELVAEKVIATLQEK